MCDLYELLLGLPDAAIAGETFNAGYQNQTVMDIAHIVKHEVEAEYPEKTDIPIMVTPTDDNRSYHINSDKIARHIGFRPKRTIEDAVHDVCRALKAGLLPNSMTDSRYYNVRTLKEREAA
jgi:nucleoside-diphosphate-sugar epimerase